MGNLRHSPVSGLNCRLIFNRVSPIWPANGQRPLLLATLLCLAGCQSTKSPSPQEARTVAPEPEATSLAETPSYSIEHDKEIKQIFVLAKQDRWEEAKVTADQLREKDPKNATVLRLYEWVDKQQELLRNQAIEDTIRRIDSQNSVFSPTVKSLLTEQADRGLPPRKDLRDAVLDIEANPYVPSSYNQKLTRSAPMFDFKNQTGRMAKELDKEFSVKLDDVTLEAIIFQIGEEEDINFVADQSLEAFKEKLSLNFDNVRLGEFLNYISRNFNLQFQVGDDLIWIVDGKDKQKTIEETRIYRLRKGFILPAIFGADEIQKTETKAKDGTVTTVTTQKAKTFVRDGVSTTPSIERAIQKFFKGSQYEIDYERNIILATGTREQLEVLERIIEEYDRHLQQVLIEARFITVSEAAFMQLGAFWETERSSETEDDQEANDFLGFGTENIGRGLQETFTDILSRDNLSVTLTALEQQGETQTLSAPRITVVNNLPARISDGKIQNYYEEYTVTQTINERTIVSTLVPSGTPKEITSGVSLEVMASIGGDGKTIYLALHPEVNQNVQLVPLGGTVNNPGRGSFKIVLPESRTQTLNTRVIVQSGQTVVMGGVLEREQSTYVESVPVLGKIPFIGSVFRRRTEVNKPRYLLIFVTATLLSETGEFIEIQDSPAPSPEPSLTP
ncbi:MAG: Type IV pilus biogenesis and competence protein PilQ [Verrucomicrobia subdivision 3 bacterium]|nr:Type IV pilus biogenesis and competence protein PilQ [Limisphaerales bacterium]MCS1416972.1 Type IV pilus biogenesis and competence protein PilQ [Limisphaerales bacterium]